MATAPRRTRRGPWILAGIAVVLAAAALTVVLIRTTSGGSGGPITDASLCSDVNALGSDPGNYEYRYLAQNQALGVRAGFEQVCQQNPSMPVTQAIQDAPGAEPTP